MIESWKCFPERFSLRKHPEFPDSNDQNKSLYGPLKKDGYVVALGDMVFRLTDAGIGRAQALEGMLNGERTASSSRRLSRDQERLLRTAKASEAYVKWVDGCADEIVDFDGPSLLRHYRHDVGREPAHPSEGDVRCDHRCCGGEIVRSRSAAGAR